METGRETSALSQRLSEAAMESGCGHAPLKFQHLAGGSRRGASLGYARKPVSKNKAKITMGNSVRKADFMSPHGLQWPAGFRSPSKQKDLKYSVFRHQCLYFDAHGSQFGSLRFLVRVAMALSEK